MGEFSGVLGHLGQETADGGHWAISGVPVLIVLAGAVLLFAIIRGLRTIEPTLPLPRVWRDRFERFGPIAELFTWSIYVAVSIAWLLDGNPVAISVLLGALVVLVVVASFFAIRDYLAGVIVRVERFARVGDRVRVGDDGTVGTVTSLGTRFAEIERPNGDVVLMPYSQLGRRALVRTQRAGSPPRHTFVVELADGVSSAMAQAVAYNAAILSHWAAPRHDPRVHAVSTQKLEITVQPIVALRADDLEVAVREALANLA